MAAEAMMRISAKFRHRSMGAGNVAIWLACLLFAAPFGGAAQTSTDAAWTLHEELRYPATDAAPLTAIRQILPLPDGRIVVTDVQDEGLLVYDAAGAFERRIGGRGEGPGEFVYIGRAVAAGDTLRVVDSQLRRIVAFTTGGAVLGVPLAIHREPVRERQDVALLRGRVLLAAIAPETTADLSLHFIGLGPTGAPTRTHAVRSIDWSQRRATLPIPLPNGKAVVHNLFSTGDLFAAAPDGGAVAWIEQPAPDSNDAGLVRVSMLSPTGATVWTAEVPYRPRRLDPRLVDEWIEGLPNIEHLVAAGLVQRAAAVKMAREAYQAPDYLPAVSTRSGHARRRAQRGGDGVDRGRRMDPALRGALGRGAAERPRGDGRHARGCPAPCGDRQPGLGWHRRCPRRADDRAVPDQQVAHS